MSETSANTVKTDALIAATGIATLFLDYDLRIQRFTPSAQALFNFSATDIGRPLSDLRCNLEYPELVADAEHALVHLQLVQREVRAGERWYLARILPHRTADDQPAGAVLTLTDVTAIKRSDQATGRLAAIVESSSDAIIGKDLRGTITSWNTAAERMFGYAAAEMIGQSITRLIPAERQAEEIEIIARITAGETIKSFETVRLRKDGTSVPISATISPIKNVVGEIVGGSKIARDISDAKRAETALRQSEERLAFVRRSSGVGFWYCDLPFDVLEWDETVKAHFHLPPDAHVTIETFYDRLHPDDREPTRTAIEHSIANRTPYDTHYRTVSPRTGAVKWLRAIGRTFYAADGSPIQFDGVTLDVSEQKVAEQQVARLATEAERERRLFDTTLSNTTDFNFIFSPDGRIAYANRSLLALWQRTAAEALGRSMAELGYPPDVAAQLLGNIRQVVETGQPVRDETPFTGPDMETGYYEYALAPVLDAGGSVVQVVGSARDIRDRKRTEDELRRLAAELREADRRKDEFLATLAHELRSPLAPIRNALHVMQLAGGDETIVQARSMMERQLTQLVRLVDDLLDVSRVTSGKLELRKSTVDLREVIDAAVETSRPAIEEAGHQLRVVVPDEPAWVDGDGMRLAQVLTNLLSNSAKYMPRGGQIRLTATHDGDTIMVSVADDGIGIPHAMLDTVFEMFSQVDRTLEKTAGGLGIGLSLVKGLIEMHGGTIVARSDGEGRGSEFIVRLPVIQPPARNAAAAEDDVPASSSSGHRILVADDNVDSAESLRLLLQMLGNDVTTVHDGSQAVALAETLRPDMILLDIGMPKLNGLEAARRIRAHAWGQGIVLIALTGWGQHDDRKRSSDAGFDHHLVKPLEISILMKLLAGLPAH